MSNHKVTKKQLASLGIQKNRSGDYDYINPNQKDKSKYEPIRKQTKKP